jgi:predicted amidohydrolase
MSIRQWKAAVVQAEPCWFDVRAAVQKTLRLMREAKAGDASLIAFSETWIPGYPNFVWNVSCLIAVDQFINYSLLT